MRELSQVSLPVPSPTDLFSIDRFRLSESKIRMALIKLKLIEMGMVKESNELEDLFIPPAIFNDSAEEATDHLASAHTILAGYEAKYEIFLKQTNSKPTSMTVSLQRIVLDAFQKSSIAAKKCESCGGFSPPLRKDGSTKLFEKPLQKRLRKSMQGMKMKLKVCLDRPHLPLLTCHSQLWKDSTSPKRVSMMIPTKRFQVMMRESQSFLIPINTSLPSRSKQE
jgi:hypothetical protein